MLKVECTSPTGSGATFHQLLAMIRDDVSSLIYMVSESDPKGESEASLALDDVAEKLDLLEFMVHRTEQKRNSQ